MARESGELSRLIAERDALRDALETIRNGCSDGRREASRDTLDYWRDLASDALQKVKP